MFKYKYLHLQTDSLEKELNKWGQDGWVVSFIEKDGPGYNWHVLLEYTEIEVEFGKN